jgi:hypothetical protein
MKWIKNIFGFGNSIDDKLSDEKFDNSIKNSTVRYGFPVDHEEFAPRKIGRMDLRICVNGENKILRINELIKLFDKKIITGSENVVITRPNVEANYFCGDGLAIDIINSWKSAALDHNDVDLPNRVNEYGFEISIKTKYELMLFDELYARVAKYFCHANGKNKIYKKFKKQEMKDLVLLLDTRNPGWDDNEIKCYDELDRFIKIFNPEKVRTVSEQKEKKRLIKLKSIEAEVNLPVVRIRNALTVFPHKKIIVEIKDLGKMEVRQIKPLISKNIVKPDTLIRYREEDEWMELSDFLEDWAVNKITVSQLQFLTALYKENSIADEIPYDLSRKMASEKITFLYEKRNNR